MKLLKKLNKPQKKEQPRDGRVVHEDKKETINPIRRHSSRKLVRSITAPVSLAWASPVKQEQMKAEASKIRNIQSLQTYVTLFMEALDEVIQVHDLCEALNEENKKHFVKITEPPLCSPDLTPKHRILADASKDMYGFVLDAAQTPVWNLYYKKFLRTTQEKSTAFSYEVTSGIDVRKLVTKGIPPNQREYFWRVFLNVPTSISYFPEEYNTLQLKTKEETNTTFDQIGKDITRSFKSAHSLDEPFKQKLTNVLRAYALRNPRVGYCQAMNMVAGGLLVLMQSEEETYWGLVHIIEHICSLYYIEDGLIGVKVDSTILGEYIEEYLPKISKHFKKTDFNLILLASSWFMTLFINHLPAECSFRIWDVLFANGPCVLFETALAVLSMFQDDIIKCSDLADIYTLLKQRMRLIFDYDDILKASVTKIDPLDLKMRREVWRNIAIEDRNKRKQTAK
mmetsp:Transcript_14452/g.16032  ORF Transcript_14452/g.16032 Transcript_14452/m.16032 type:complete len:453 (+) Transcript_14452:44-1402(+)